MTCDICPRCGYCRDSDACCGRCVQCGNHPQLCGHDLPFAERIKSVRANTENLRRARR